MTVFSAHWHHDILQLTAREILARYDASALPDVRLLMPNRRSCIAMREAFASIAPNETLLLPHIVPLSDTESELLMGLVREQDRVMDMLRSIPPAMSRWHRRMLLVDLVKSFERHRTGGLAPSLRHSLALVDDLIDIHDACLRESVSLESVDIGAVALGNMAEHWQMNAAFLRILFNEWPSIERHSGMVPMVAREQRILQAITDLWSKSPPPYPVWMVGSTGSMPAVRALMAAVHAMHDGHVVLPGLDNTLREVVTIGHGQYYLHASLEAMQVNASDVQWLGDKTPQARQSLWAGHAASAVDGIELIECSHEEEEAGIISLIVREALKSPDKTIAVVTPNPALMGRVALYLRRYDVQVSTPQGTPLSGVPAGQLWARMVRCLREEVSVLSLLELAHCPHVNCSETAQDWHDFLLDLRRSCRGVLVPMRMSQRLMKHGSKHSVAVQLAAHITEIEAALSTEMSLQEWLQRLRKLANYLAPARLEGHEALQQLLEQLENASYHEKMNAYDIADLLEDALTQPLRLPDFSAHPRVAVLSPIEARLQRFDRVILAGFNEGDWPQTYQPNPWLNLKQRENLGLSAPDAIVTLAAHDIQMLGMAQELFITRSAKAEGSPTTLSRFLIKLQTQLARSNIALSCGPWKEWWQKMKHADPRPIAYDAPKPPVDSRPRTLKVTSLHYLFSDPYAIYAEYVLGLKELEPFDKMPDAATFGSLIHRLIETMLRDGKSADDTDWLLSHIDHLEANPRLYSIWLPRIRSILRFVSVVHAQRAAAAVDMEIKKEIAIGEMALVGKIDRLEKQGDAYSIHDYKTGAVPSKSEMEAGFMPQLIAYALMLSIETGREPESLLYWALPKARQHGELVEYAVGDMPLREHMEMLKRAILRIQDADYAFHALNADSAYAGVSRNDEWAA